MYKNSRLPRQGYGYFHRGLPPFCKANKGTRTPDPRITNALLYQLSHIGEKRVQRYNFFLYMQKKSPLFFVPLAGNM